MESEVTETRPADILECRRATVPMAEVLMRIGSKWTVYVIIALTRGPRRFSELKREIEGISQKMLTATLRDLEEDGFVTRTVTPTIPPRVDYELTELGQSLQRPICGLATWATENVEAIHSAQARFDAQQDEARAA